MESGVTTIGAAVDGSQICGMTSVFFSLSESIRMIAGHCMKSRQDTDAGLALPSALPAVLSLCVLEKSSCCGQGTEVRITAADLLAVLASSDCSKESGTPASLLSSMNIQSQEVKMGTTHPIYEHHKTCWLRPDKPLSKPEQH